MGKGVTKKIIDPFNIVRPVVKHLTGANVQKDMMKAQTAQMQVIENQNAKILAQQQATPAPAPTPAPVQEVQQQVQTVQADAVRREKRRAKIKTNLAGATNLNMTGQ